MYLHTAPLTTRLFQNRLRSRRHTPLLLTGPTGTGKVTAIKCAIAEVNCLKDFRPFQTGQDARECACPVCLKIRTGSSVDLLYLNGKEKVEEIRERVGDFYERPPKELDRRYLLLRNANYYSKATSDHLLKLLEQPPPYLSIFITASNPTMLPGAILSRCLHFAHPFTPRERLVELVKQVPVLTVHTRALTNTTYAFQATRQLTTFNRLDFPKVFQYFFTDATSVPSLEANARLFFQNLATDEDYPAEEARVFAMHYFFDRLRVYIRLNVDVQPGWGVFEQYLHDATMNLQDGLLGYLGDPRASQYINLENQFVHLLLALYAARRVALLGG